MEIDDSDMMNFPSGYTKGDRSKYEIVMLDNDRTPVNLLMPSATALTEAVGGRTATFELSIDRRPKADPTETPPFTGTDAETKEDDARLVLGYTGTASRGTDYRLNPNNDFMIGKSPAQPPNGCSLDGEAVTCTVTLTVLDDDLYEGGVGTKENVKIDLDTGNSSFTGGISKPNSLNLTIEDDELQPMFSIADVSGPEDGNLTFTVKREGASGNNVSVTAGTGSHSGATDSATEGTDYTTNSQKLDFGRGNITQTFEVAITDDNIDEPDKETFAVTLSNPVDNQGLPKPAIADGTATGTITDNDDPVSFSIADAEATEGDKITFTVNRAGAEGNVASVKVATAADSGDGVNAAGTSDYTVIATAQTLNFAKGVTSQTVEVQTTQDDLFEPDETFRAVLSDAALADGDPGTGASIESDKGTATGTIKNDDTQPSFAVADASASEGDAITFTVTRSGAMDNVVSVKWNTKAATGAGAASTSDYTEMTTATKLDFAKGVGTQTFTVATTEDVLHEGNETFLVELTEAVGGTITTAEATGTITDDDAAPSGITLSVDTNGSTAGTPSTVAEDAGATVVTVTATVNGTTRYVDAKTVAVSVADDTAASPADYAAVSSFNITIAAGAASHTGNFTVTPVDDNLDESDETINVTGTLSSVTITAATVTLTDTDDPVSFSIADAEATEGGKITFTVSRGGAEDNVASVKVVTAADSGDGVNAAGTSDYTVIATAQTLNFAKGITSQTVEVQTTQDDLFEPDETFKAVLSDPALGQDDPGTGVSIESGKGTATGTIKNDDTQPSFAVADASASEGDAITFTVTRTGAMDNVVSVKWNTKAASGDGAASATDYTEMTTATKLDFAKGEGSQTFTVATTEDVLHESDETFLVELTEPVGATITDAEATGTITNDDAAPTTLTLAVDADNATENVQTSLAENGGAKTVKVTATLGGSTQFDVDKTLTLTVGKDGDSATEGTDYTTVDNITLTIPAGDQDVEHTFTLTPTDDAFREDTETISFDATLTGVTVSGASITLTSDDAAPAITLTVDADKDTDNVQTSLAEDGGVKTVRVTATLDGTTRLEEAADLTLAVGKDGDSAEEGTDYTTVADRTISIGAGVASVTHDFTLTPTNDNLYEGSETISLEGTLTGVAVTDTSLTLTDDDAQPSFAVADASASEGDAITFTVTRSGAMDNVVSVKWNTKADTSDGANAALATDYTAVPTARTLTFAKGVGTQTFTVATTEDVLHEGAETFLVELTEPTGAIISDAEATGTINDDDAAPSGITLTVSPATVGEEDGETEITVTATVNGTTRYVDAKTVTISVGGGSATSDTDYDAVANFDIVIAAGDASKAGTFDLTPTDDDLYEGNETIDVTGTSNSLTITKASITLEDDDTEPSFAVADASAAEGDAITFTVTRTGAMDNAVSVKWNTKAASGDGAASATDYTEMTTATKLDFAKGVGTQTFTVATTEDVLHESDETFLVELTEPVGATITDAEATGTITNDDAAPTTLTLAVDADNATENVQTSLAENGGAKTVKVTATLGGSTQFDVDKTLTLTVGKDDDSATEGTDYTTVDNITLTIPAGDQDVEHTFTLTPTNDAFREDTETISFDATLTGVTASGASITLTSDDAAPAITLTVDADKDTDNVQTSLAEDGGVKTVRVTATLDGTTRLEEAADLTLAVGKDGDSAEEGTDYTTVADRTISIGAGVASVTHDFTLTPTNDNLYEGSETISLEGTLTGVAVTDTSLTLTDDDAQPSFAVADASALEGDAITFTVTRSGAMDNEVSVKWNTKADTGAGAASATDYTEMTTATMLDFAKGVGSQTFTVATTEDNLDEDDETFLVELTGAVDGTITTAEATGTITDDDAAPSGITLSVDTNGSTAGTPSTVAEDAGATVVTVTATVNGTTRYVDAKTVAVSVADDTAASPADYAAVSSFNITIAAGAASHTGNFTVTPVDDDLDEANETIDVTGTLTDITITAATVTLTDTDDPVSFSIADAEATEGGKITFTVSRGGAEDNVASVKVVTAADSGDGVNAAGTSDYTVIATAQTLNFAKGITSQTVEVQTTQDDLFEPDETFKAVLSEPALGDGDPGTGVTIESGKGTATGTIKNDDTQPSFAVADASASEGDAITFTVTRSGAMDNVVSVKWNTKADTSDGANAALATDYTAVPTARTLTFAKGVGTQTFTVATTEDVLHEGAETFLVELTEPTGAIISDAEATGTINDDDAAPSGITLTVSPNTVGEEDGETEITVTATVNGTTRYPDAHTVTISVGGGTATSATDYDAVANFDIVIAAGDASKAGTFDLTPTDDDLHEGSETIDVTGTSGALSITKAEITLTDNDGQPSFAVADASAAEGDAITFTVTRTGAMDNAVSVKWNTKADTSDGANAASATDYTPATTATKLDFAKGVGTQTFTVATTEDTLNEGNETFLVELTEPVGATIADAEATGTITNDDAVPTTLTLAVDADNATENVQTSLAENGGAKTVKVTATLGGSTQFDVDKTVTLIIGDDDDSATEGTDYTTVDDITLTIPAGDQDVEHTFTLTPTNDAFREDTETISFDATLTGVTVSGASITLTSDDAAPAITLTVDADKDTDNVQTSLAEDGGVKTVRVTATLDGTTRLEEAADLTLAVGKDGDSAEEGTDYTTVADRTISIGAGVASVTDDFTLTPTNDNLYEGSETISLDGTLTGVAVTNTSLTLTDDDTQPSFAVADASASEGDAITFTVTRSGAMDNVVSVKWNTKADTGAGAASATDYTEMTTATKLDFAKGVGSQTFTVATTEDNLDEDDETFLVELTGAVDGTITTAEATGTITDDDAAPSGITLSVDTNGSTAGTPSTVAEDAGATVVTVTATVNGTTRYVDAKTVAVSVADDTAASPADYAAVSSFNITIAAGAASHTGNFTVTPVDDDLDEANETIDVTGTLTDITITAATVTLTDTDDPVSFSIADAEATEGGKITFTVSRGGAEDNVASVKVVTAADSGDGVNAAGTSDYTVIATAQTLNFAKGITSQTVEVQTTQDDLFEPDETFKAVLSEPALGDGDPGTGVTIESGKGTATGTIKNDDTQPSFAVADASASEGDAITFTVTRSGAMDNVVSVKWNTKAASGDGAAEATDYTPVTTATTLTFVKGVSNRTFTVATTEDVLAEGNETFLVELTGAVGGTITTAQATGTINDDDAAPGAITISVDTDTSAVGTQTTIAENGGAKTVRVTATITDATRFVEAKTVTLEVGMTADSATESTDYTEVPTKSITINAGAASGYVDFTLTPTDDTLHEGSETIILDGTLTGVTVTDATITLTDDDGAPTALTLSVDADTGTNNVQTSLTENGGAKTVRVTATLGGSSTFTEAKTVTLEVGADTDSATEGADYTEVETKSFTINAGASSGYVEFTLTPTDDTRHETSETISLDGTLDSVTVTDASLLLTDNDAAPTTLTLAVDADNATENVQTSLAENGGAKTVKVTATLGGSTQFDVDKTVTLIIGDDDDSATEGTDYTTVDDITLTIPAGDQDVEHTFTLTPTNDAFREDTETISFDATLTGVTVSGASITLTSDDAAPAITLTVDADKDTDNVQTSLAEDGGVKTVRVTATLDGTTRLEEAADLTLAVGKDGDSAEEGTDYTTIADRTITIGAGVASVTDDFTLTPTNDNLYEGTETISLDGTLTGVAVTNTSLTLTDDDAQPSFAVADASASEGDAITFTVTRSGAMDNVVSVKWNTKADTSDGANAASGTDYTAMPTATKLDFAKGVGTQTFTVATTEDVLHEGAETFLVELTEPTGAIISDAEATGTITDDDAAPTGITLSVDTNGSTAGTPSTVAEDAGATVVTVTATVNGATRYVDSKIVAVSVADGTAASPADYAAVNNFNITIAEGAASHNGSFTVTPVDDDLDESNETIDVTGTLSSVTITGATVTFTDNDDPVSFSIADAEATEGGKITFTVSRAGAEDNVASVKIATAADSGDGVNAASTSDYTAIATAQTLNFAKDITSQTVEVQTTQDDLFEPDETFRAVLSDPALGENDPGTGVTIEMGKGTAIGTIKNDDAQPSFAVADASASEGDAITFTVTRTGAMDNAVSVKWNTKADTSDGANAASVTDYTAVPTATKLDFAKGVGTQTFTVATTEDVLHEGNETFLIELTEPVGGTITDAEATGTITDDDAASSGITLTVSPNTVGEGDGETEITVTATVNGTTRYPDAHTVTISVGGGTATSATDYDAVANFDIVIAAGDASKAGTFDLTPTDDDLHEGSETIDVTGTSGALSITKAEITLTDNDGQPSFAVADASAAEGDAITFTVTRTGAMDNAVSVKWNTKADTSDGANAASGTDYTEMTTATKLDFAKGVGTQTFTVATTEDTLNEGNETFLVELTEPVGATIADAEATGTITNDDAVPTTLTLAVDADNATENVQTSLAENGGAKTVKVTATLGGSTQFDVDKTVTLIIGDDDDSATEGTDYTTVDDITLTIPAGDQDVEHTFTLTPTNDAFREDTETISFDATLTGVTVSGASITLTSDDAAPAITLTVDADKDTDNVQTSLAEDGGVKTVRVTATLDGTTRLEEAADLTLAVGKDGDSAEEGTDYTTVADRTISIGAGVASVTDDFTLTPTNDNLYEGSETISLDGTLTGVAVTNTSLTLTDDDTQPSFAVADASASEGDAITFTVTRSGAMDNVVSVKWNTKADERGWRKCGIRPPTTPR